MRLTVAGEVRIEAANGAVAERQPAGRQARLVLAYLASQHGRPVPRDELAEALWGDELPPTWQKALAGIVSKLRTLLDECGADGATALTNAFGCYQLQLPPGSWIDVVAAEAAVRDAEAALAAGDDGTAHEQAAAAGALARQPF